MKQTNCQHDNEESPFWVHTAEILSSLAPSRRHRRRRRRSRQCTPGRTPSGWRPGRPWSPGAARWCRASLCDGERWQTETIWCFLVTTQWLRSMEIVEDCTSEIIQVKIKIVNKTKLIFSERTLKMKWWKFSLHETSLNHPVEKEGSMCASFNYTPDRPIILRIHVQDWFCISLSINITRKTNRKTSPV